MNRSPADQIAEDIVFGVHPPGSRLVEDRLQTRLGLSRYTLRAVKAELEGRGLVHKIPNRGVEVVEPTPDEIDELYAIRDLLETHAATLTDLPVPAALAADLDTILEEHRAAAQSGDMRRVFRLNIAFHGLQFSACPNGRLRQAIEDYARRVHVVRAVKYGDPGHLARVVDQHREIVGAMRGDDTERYVAAVRAHLPDSALGYRQAWTIKHGAGAIEDVKIEDS